MMQQLVHVHTGKNKCDGYFTTGFFNRGLNGLLGLVELNLPVLYEGYSNRNHVWNHWRKTVVGMHQWIHTHWFLTGSCMLV